MQAETWTNEVLLSGRLSAAPLERELPSGDVMVQLRVVVPRPRAASKRMRVDTIDVACWTARTRRSALRLEAGTHIQVTGALRRRFFRAGAAAVSRYEVEAATVTKVHEAAGRGADDS